MIPIVRLAWCVPLDLALVLLGATETASARSRSAWNKRAENGDTLIGIALASQARRRGAVGPSTAARGFERVRPAP